jgi:hypothetical protein
MRASTAALFALSPTERLSWHERWRQHIRMLVREGKDVGKELYGIEGLSRPSR